MSKKNLKEEEDSEGEEFDRRSLLIKSKGLRSSQSRFNLFTDPQITTARQKHKKLWELMSSYLSTDIEDIEQFIANHVEYTLAHTRHNFDEFSAYKATAFSLRDRMIEFWNDTQAYHYDQRVKRVYYLSIEYLLGRSMQNAIINLGMKDQYSIALKELGADLESLYTHEKDAALGNGGLGRLAACFLDSLATMEYPAWGYGIRYQYGIFKQQIVNGYQAETPDFWLIRGNPFEIPRNDVQYKVYLGGSVSKVNDHRGHLKHVWNPENTVIAMAYDTPIIGYGTMNTINLRLWSSRPSSEFDFAKFNAGNYEAALKEQQRSSTITNVLYPNDNTPKGKHLRLTQQYFFVSATLQDIMRRFKKSKKPLEELHTLAAIQLNDTHPVIAIPELMRILVDLEGLGWDIAWNITKKVFAYTNHTVLPEALEKWSTEILGSILPRHLEIIYEINKRFLALIRKRFPQDEARVQRMSLVQEHPQKMIRMSHLGIVGSHSVNGVAAMHTEIIKESIFKDFVELYPEKFNNKTNGVTPRRWILNSNPSLSEILKNELGSDDWVTDLSLLEKLKGKADDEDLQQAFADSKLKNKRRLKARIEKKCRVTVNEHALFDVHIKRIHEYKRQLMNILSVIHRYQTILEASAQEKKEMTARVVIFAGKAAPGYDRAKMIIKLINNVAEVVNQDPEVGDLLKVVFLPDYNVSLAELIIPAADISQHVSTAGTEASGTSNMKFAMNSGLLLGTYDGANIEIAEEVGEENLFIFGARSGEVQELRSRGERSIDERLYKVLLMIESGKFEDGGLFRDVISDLWRGNDYYLTAHDFPAYLKTQQKIDEEFKDLKSWRRKMILTTAGMGKFSSDRTISEYAEDIWKVEPCKLPIPENHETNFPKQKVGSPYSQSSSLKDRYS